MKILLAAILGSVLSSAFAQDYPAREIRSICNDCHASGMFTGVDIVHNQK